MKQSKYNSIHEVAKLFGITVPTLHFWESKNLFHISKNTQNKYREFKFSDILNIWEIVFYRKLNIPIKVSRRSLKMICRIWNRFIPPMKTSLSMKSKN